MNTLLVYGVGRYYPAKHKARHGAIMNPTYRAWQRMLERAYCPEMHARFPSYKGVTVCEEWLDFQTFADWYEANKVEGWHLDKDLLSGDQKVYSPETCCFLPASINAFLRQGVGDRFVPDGVSIAYRKTKRGRSFDGFTSCGKSFGRDMYAARDYYLETRKARIKNFVEKYSTLLSEDAKKALEKMAL